MFQQDTLATPVMDNVIGDSDLTRATTSETILSNNTTSKRVEAELQCTLCFEVLYKPITTICGHSFCRVCLMDYLLSRDLQATICPICRSQDFTLNQNRNPPSFHINVTLWNLIQMIVPTREVNPTEEDDFVLKSDQYAVKIRLNELQHAEQAPMSSESEVEILESPQQPRSERFPERRIEEMTVDRLHLTRNIVLDTDDRNEDGYQSQRVSLAVIDFPSLFQLYTTHQDCSLAIIKVEEDEEMTEGMPFFMNEDGEDDDFIISDYYNQITLRIVDQQGTIRLERTRAARQGVVQFPELCLNAPGGEYEFRFSDDLYGVFFTIRTTIRELNEEREGVELEDREDEYESEDRFILREAAEEGRAARRQDGGGSRVRRRRQQEAEEEDLYDEETDDSFIVNDDEVDDESLGDASFTSVDEELEQEMLLRERHSIREIEHGASEEEGNDSDEEHNEPPVRSHRRGARNFVVLDDDDDDSDIVHDHATNEADNRGEPEMGGDKKRLRLIEESEDEECEGTQAHRGHKRLRSNSNQMFYASDEEEKEEYHGDFHHERGTGDSLDDEDSHHHCERSCERSSEDNNYITYGEEDRDMDESYGHESDDECDCVSNSSTN